MSVNNKLIDIEKLSRYHENLKEVLNTKEAAGEAAKAEAAAKKYADEEIAKLSFDEAGAAGEAYEAAKEYADDLVKNEDGSVKFDDKGAAAAAQAAAEATAAADATSKANAAQSAAEATASADATSKANAAESAAKTYADGLVKDADGNVKFDEKGAAAAAQAAAEATAAADATSKANAAQAAAEQKATDLNTAMNERVVKLEAIDHEQLAADASAAAVAAIVAGAESDFDTLKEVADWINSDTTGAAALQIKVAENADAITDLTNDKQDAISDLETIRTGAAAGAVAEQNAKDYAKDYADGLATNYDASGSAATAEQNAKDYATGLVMDGENARFDAAGSAAGAQAAAEATAKAYADAEIVKVNANIEENERVTAESLTDLDTRVKDLKDTTYNKTEIDTIVGNVIVVASDEEIDNLFN